MTNAPDAPDAGVEEGVVASAASAAGVSEPGERCSGIFALLVEPRVRSMPSGHAGALHYRATLSKPHSATHQSYRG